ncbi:MAG: hypothetical protein AAGJ29_09500 [Pseudomonadota bacterium]
MSNIIQFPKHFVRDDSNEPWSIGKVTIVGGNFYLSIDRMWSRESRVAPGVDRLELTHEREVKNVGNDPNALVCAWNNNFNDNIIEPPNLPPVEFDYAPPQPLRRSKRVVERDWLRLEETKVYEGPA